MRKTRPDSNQSNLTAEQTERLMEACHTMGYYRAVLWAKTEFGLVTTTASLCRWYRKNTSEQTRGRLRKAIETSKDFDAELDSRNMDARAANALRAALWDALTDGTPEQIKLFGQLVLDYNKAEYNASRLELEGQRVAELQASNKLAREKFEAAEARINEAKAVVTNPQLSEAERMARIRGIFGLS